MTLLCFPQLGHASAANPQSPTDREPSVFTVQAREVSAAFRPAVRSAIPGAEEEPARYPVLDLDGMEALPLPERGLSFLGPAAPSAAVQKDGRTHPPYPLLGGDLSSTGSRGELSPGRHEGEGGPTTYDFGSPNLVSCTSCFPNRMAVHMFVTFPNGANGHCSGMLIDSRHVLTAGHCVFNSQHGGWASAIVVRPGRSGNNVPYGSANMETAMAWTGFTVGDDSRHDIAVVRLDRPVGALTGWMSFGTASSCGSYTTPYWYLKSYPGSPYSGNDMYGELGDFDGCPDIFRTIRHRAGIPGQSGSAAYRYLGGTPVAYAVTAYNYYDWWYGWDLASVRLTSNKFLQVMDFISSATPSTYDFTPLDVDADTLFVPRGGTIQGLNYLVHNYSSASRNGSTSVFVYLSEDDNISFSDNLIHTQSFSANLGPKDSVRVNGYPVPVPWTLAPGMYYLGVQLIAGDANSSNNETDGQDTYRLWVY